MKKEKTEELYVKWVDGLLTPEEEAQLNALMEENPELEPDLYQSRMVAQTVREVVPESVEPPYGDFFNSQLMRKVDLEVEAQSPAKKAERWWTSFRWAWAPAGALALVLAFFAGHRVGKPDSPTDGLAAVGQAPTSVKADVVSVYFTSDSLEASVVANEKGEVSAIVVDGLDALKDDLDLATASSHESDDDMEGLPVSYVRSEARRFQ